MQMKRLAALATTAVLVAACSSTAATPVPTAAPATQAPGTQAPAASATAATLSGALTIWTAYGSGGSAEGAAMDTVLTKAKAAFPGLTVTRVEVPFSDIFTKIQTAWGAGEQTPDMFITPNDSLGSLQRQGILYGPLDDVLKPSLSSFTDISIAGSKVNGHIYEIPESMKAVSMFYNKSLVTTPPATTADLLALAKSGIKIGIAEYAAAYYNWWIYNAFGGGPLMDNTGKCVADTNGTSDGFAYLKALKDTGNVTFYTTGSAFQGDFKTGKLGIVIEGPWGTGDFKTALGDKLGIALIPAGPKGKALPLSAPDGWYINVNANDTQKALAVKFALWEVSAAGGEQTFADSAGHLPAVKDATVTDTVAKAFLAQIDSSYPRPQTKQLDNYWTPFGNAFDEVIVKGTDPVTAVKTACASMNKANGL
jgi:arabinogalactan oligomer / maltooligosaccharide transport system substrate-binding protein